MLEPIGLPSVTMPFILATWIMLFAGRPHRNIENKN
ncbi:urea transporter [Staphylococcus warneri]